MGASGWLSDAVSQKAGLLINAACLRSQSAMKLSQTFIQLFGGARGQVKPDFLFTTERSQNSNPERVGCLCLIRNSIVQQLLLSFLTKDIKTMNPP